MAVDTTVLIPVREPAGAARGRLKRLVGALAAHLCHYRKIQRERAQLRALSDRELHDIGISRYDALQEARKPFWRS